MICQLFSFANARQYCSIDQRGRIVEHIRYMYDLRTNYGFWFKLILNFGTTIFRGNSTLLLFGRLSREDFPEKTLEMVSFRKKIITNSQDIQNSGILIFVSFLEISEILMTMGWAHIPEGGRWGRMPWLWLGSYYPSFDHFIHPSFTHSFIYVFSERTIDLLFYPFQTLTNVRHHRV